MKHSLSEVLRHEIEKRCKTIYRLSEDSGIPYTTIVNVLKRGVENSTVSTVLKICNALHIGLDKLVKTQKIWNIIEYLTDNTPSDSDEPGWGATDLAEKIRDAGLNYDEYLLTRPEEDIDLSIVIDWLYKEVDLPDDF